MRALLIPLLALACSADPAQHVAPLKLADDGGATSEPVTPPQSGTGGVAAGAGGSAGSTVGAAGTAPKGGSGSASGSSGESGSAGTLAGSPGRAGEAGVAGMAGVAGTGIGGSAGTAGAPVGGAGSSGAAGTIGGSSGSSSTSGEAGTAGTPEPDPEPKCLLRRMAPHDEQCLVREVPGCPQVGELIAPPNTCVWSTDVAKHDGCSSESSHLECQVMCAGSVPVTKVISFARYTSAKIFLFEGPHIRCWDIPTQKFGAPCDETCDLAAQAHEAYSCSDPECIDDWAFTPLCDEPVPVGDDLNSCS